MSPTLASGVAGGFLATVVATAVFFVAGQDRPLPAARLWVTYVDEDARLADAIPPGLALHALYGTVMGGTFALLLAGVMDPAGDVSLWTGVAWGVGYGLALFALDVGGWLHAVLGVRIDGEALAEFLVLHVIYGTALGAWVGVGVLGVG
jgi:hypothetical protein